MSLEFEHALLALRSDCERSVGSPFLNFYCPILFRDEEVPLCKAHIVNTAFPSSHRCWVVQRKDLDNFYGSHFENDFVDIQYRGKNFTESILADPYLSKNLSPKIRFGDKGIEHFVASGPVPANFTEAAVGGPSGPVRLGLKIHPDDAVTEIKNDWSIVIEKDIRLPALVSILKAAHLTIFKMLGYSYALSAGGHLLGWEILGKFFLGNHALARPQVLANARAHSTEFANMVRPLLDPPADVQGTASDQFVFVCRSGSETPWGIVVFVRTSNLVHAALIPVLETAVAAARFAEFLRGEACTLRAARCHFDNGEWYASKQEEKLTWPKAELSTPL